ncbi:MAG TPA: DUF1566 domain-containing protein, partial [Bacteriovoracaceae bacterium]|nr:DUF1566 domain-containing protein [Bacteriovoracaceae bacterium]
GGVGTTQLADGSITDAKVSATAAIARTKLAAGTLNHVLINDVTTGEISSAATLPITLGGTGAATAAAARTNLGLGTAAQADIGTAATNVMAGNAPTTCTATQKLTMDATTFAWSCITDTDTTADATKLPLAGGTMSGAIAMGTNKITGLATPTAAAEASTKKYVDDNSHWVLASGNISRASGAVGIGASAAPAGILDLTSTTLGFLMPRMTATTGITSPAEGLQIYNTTTNEINYYDGTAWKAVAPAGTKVTSIAAGTGLSGGTITSTGTLAISAGGVSATELATDSVTDGKIAAAAAIDRTKLAAGTANHILVNGAGGLMSSLASLPASMGGTGLTSLTADKLYVSNTAGTAFEILPCLTATFLSFDAVAKIACPGLTTATATAAGIISITAQSLAGVKTFNANVIASAGIKVGPNTGLTCDASAKGNTRFNATSKKLEICNGTAWTAVNENYDPCDAATPTAGTVCNKGAIFAGSQSNYKYMTTPGGCGEITYTAIVGAGTTAYPSTDFTPICSGTDTIQKTWASGSSYDQPSLANYTTTAGVNGATNIDANFGSANTTNIASITVAGSGGYHTAARYCDRLIYGGYSDWFLPNRYELNLLFINKASIPGLLIGEFWYWSSTEMQSDYAWGQRFSDGYQYIPTGTFKTGAAYVRCMRKYADPCLTTNTPGTVCQNGSIFLGALGSDRYMTTVGGCGQIPAGLISGTGTTAYPISNFTPTCTGSTDTLKKTWNDSSANPYDIPALTNYTTTSGVGYGAINIDANYGSANTTAISAITLVAQGGYHPAARYCENLVLNGYTDWYLPNRAELNLMFTNKTLIPGLEMSDDFQFYWSSTEYLSSWAWMSRFNDGSQIGYAKTDPAHVRCVRKM